MKCKYCKKNKRIPGLIICQKCFDEVFGRANLEEYNDKDMSKV